MHVVDISSTTNPLCLVNVVCECPLTYLCSGAGTGGATGPPQYLADQLILFQPGRAEYPHQLLLAPPMFFTFRHYCSLDSN